MGRPRQRPGTDPARLCLGRILSPEQCEGREDLDAKVDVYALGVMLFEMLSGRLPFHADTAAALMRQHMFKEPPKLRDIAPDVPKELDELVAQMLTKEPGERPTMEQIAARLEALLPQVSGRTSPLVSGVHAPRIARRTQVPTEGESTDPFAATLGGADSVPSAFASTLGAGNLGSDTGPSMRSLDGARVSLQSGSSSGIISRPQASSSGVGMAVTPVAGEGVSSTAKIAGAALWVRRLVVVAGVLLLLVAAGALVLHSRSSTVADVAGPSVPTPAAAPPAAPAPPPVPTPPTAPAAAAAAPAPAPAAAAALDEEGKPKAGEDGKKGKKRGKGGRGSKPAAGHEDDADKAGKSDKRGDDAEKPWY